MCTDPTGAVCRFTFGLINLWKKDRDVILTSLSPFSIVYWRNNLLNTVFSNGLVSINKRCETVVLDFQSSTEPETQNLKMKIVYSDNNFPSRKFVFCYVWTSLSCSHHLRRLLAGKVISFFLPDSSVCFFSWERRTSLYYVLLTSATKKGRYIISFSVLVLYVRPMLPRSVGLYWLVLHVWWAMFV